MTEIKDLNKLIKSMKPALAKDNFVFCTLSEKQLLKLKIKPKLIFREKEGVTVIVDKKIADKNSLKYSSVWAMITLTIHSDLNAVGFLAAITNKLAKYGITVNVVSAYYHDHLFVPFKKAKKAMLLLKELSSKAV
ncbi:MAG: hypothetical protein COT15_01740 [Candidatus Diapherotrites archaeon CG08_land_8_20_14_0_20_34_12]|nr:MAG: hypothetical protein COT15_01740 [Candidatus Diapherotrites archaeon CG08_land_8_20_14_0_20_34_12]